MASKSSASTLQVSELCKVTPAADSPGSATQFTLPLTYLDTTWFRFPPVELVYFYKPTASPIPPHSFYSLLLPKLKRSLSLTLAQFLPLAGQLRWPPQSPTPVVIYTPGDAVSLTIAESTADLDRLAGDAPREAAESRPYVPQLEVSETTASVISLQITYFRNRGFSVAITLNHAVIDGKTTAMFLKAWASICKHGENHRLPKELTPSFNRTAVEDPSDLATAYLNRWDEVLTRQSITYNPRSLNVFQKVSPPPPDLLRATFQLSPNSIGRLREKILSHRTNSDERLHLSSFVVTCALVAVCLVKARGGRRDRDVYLVWSVDCRARLDLAAIPSNYFGNCLGVDYLVAEAGSLMGEDGIAVAAEKISELVRGVATAVGEVNSEAAVEKMGRLRSVGPEVQKFGVAGSHKLGFYQIDFGLGKPVKMETTSLDKTRGISVAESGDGSGGIEVGVVLVGHEMEAFESFFVQALKDVGGGHRCSRL
ncbi:unnamed protein product [Linum tenue]|uniref:Uncharacterized protein n=4 Tax=Linum tenue TaxID=586396 RepID=A0AAV0HSF6_9ROSI|nr:unnamed protein product [Linum tenue]